MWRKFFMVLVSIMVVLGLLSSLALRDNPARAALGERHQASNGGVRINYFTHGSPSGIPVVLLPSYARSASDFNELAAALVVAGYRTIAMQPRGIDGSSLPGLETTYHDYASDLRAVLQAEGISDPISLIGHAYGNRVARTFANNYPEAVQGLILLSAGGEAPTPPEVSLAIMKGLFGIFPASTREQAVAFAFFAEGNRPPDYWYRGWYPLAGLAQANATASTPYDQWGSGGDAPMVILHAVEDRAAVDGAASLQNRFPQRVTLHEIANAGHALLPEQPEKIRQLVLAGLEQLQAGRGRQ